MHDVDQLLEQDEVAWGGSDTRTNQDAIELTPLKLGGDYRLRSLAKVDEALMRVIAKRLQPFFSGGKSRQHFCGGHTWKGGEVG